MQMRKNTNIDYIIGTYLKDKDTINPFTQKKLSKTKRIENMYNIIQNYVYNMEFNNHEKILASQFITKILKEKE